VVDAVTNGRSLWIATCNSIGALPTELRRRFTLGTFFFDLPSPEERAAIWKIYLAKYGVTGESPDDQEWTGAEIKECCRKAYRLKPTLKESAECVVPVSRSAADQIRTLRRNSSARLIPASIRSRKPRLWCEPGAHFEKRERELIRSSISCVECLGLILHLAGSVASAGAAEQ